jgi:uracil-DNA glycosylase family 4
MQAPQQPRAFAGRKGGLHALPETTDSLLKPRFILCAGRTAAQAMLGTTEGINKLRSTVRDFEGIPLVPTYHPSALLRDQSLKRPAWEDLKRLRSLIESDEGSHG